MSGSPLRRSWPKWPLRAVADSTRGSMIICKSQAEIEKLRRAGRLAREILQETQQLARPGVSTLELERFVEKRVVQLGARPAFKGYRGYPCCLCTSVQDEIIHGIPAVRRLKP